MTDRALWLILLYLAALTLLAAPLGSYIHRVMQGPQGGALPLRPERLLYRCCGIDSTVQMSWRAYAVRLIAFNAAGTLLLYLLQRLQAILPLNPVHLGGVPANTAFNNAVSFASNTSWQSYVPESTLSTLTQMVGLTPQAFLSGATGIAALMVLMRAFVARHSQALGNVWRDLTRATLYVLMPLALILAVVLVAQGSIQTLTASRTVVTLQSAVPQELPMGPVASQTAIALLSGDGGGYFNVNSAHPFANPTPLTNFIEMLAILLVPAALCLTFGRMVGDRRQGWTLYSVMAVVLAIMSALAMRAEQAGNPSLSPAQVAQKADATQGGGNLEGKELRFGAIDSALFASVTTAGGDGAVDSMHDSFTALGGLVPLALMQLGEVIFGGPGSGLYGMLVYAVIAMFLCSLMVGRAPEYLGKAFGTFELKMASIVLLVAPLFSLVATAAAVLLKAGLAGLGNPGAHGFSEVLYAFTSTANNNGSAFAGLSTNTTFYNVTTALVMWFGRFMPLVAVLAMAGSLAAKNRRQPGAGTLSTHGPLFAGLLLFTVLLFGALSWAPAIAMGPIAEQLPSCVQGQPVQCR